MLPGPGSAIPATAATTTASQHHSEQPLPTVSKPRDLRHAPVIACFGGFA